MKEPILNTGYFSLSISLSPFKQDDKYEPYATLYINVESNGFSAKGTMDVFKSDIADFYKELSSLYVTLNGTATIAQRWDTTPFLKFEGDGKGHITVSGIIISEYVLFHKLQFENLIDQTSLKDFLKDFAYNCKSYIE